MNDYMRGWSDGHKEGLDLFKIVVMAIYFAAIIVLVLITTLTDCKATPINEHISNRADVQRISSWQYAIQTRMG